MYRRALLGSALGVSVALFISISASAAQKSADQAALFRKKLSNEQKIAHALARLTFGPRAGDEERVKRMGLKKWIDLQLHPERIRENPTLEAKLAPLDTLRMPSEELVEHYPPPQVIRAVADGRMPLPSDPKQRALYERLATRFKSRGQETGGGRQEDAGPALRSVLSEEQIFTLRNGKIDERMALLRSLPSDKLDTLIAALPNATRQQLLFAAPSDLRRRIMDWVAPQQVVAFDLNEAKLYRSILSERQLAEVLTDFWYNHFNVFFDKGADRYLVTSYERDAIRPHILGKFKDLLQATAEHPAMLFYLDNWQSVDPKAAERAGGRRRPAARNTRGLNENYGRELLELHTLGVDGGYTQRDVVEVARCFTGWTIRNPQRGGGFVFDERMHDPDEKTVLGVKVPAGGGKQDGLKVLDILVHHPSTARFISRKLAQRFVADNPPETLVDRMAKTFQATEGDIREVLRTMFDSKEFFSEGAYRAKLKSPLEMVASAARALNADVQVAFGLANQVAQMGQPLYRKQEPTGYSNSSEEWLNSAALLARMNFGLALAQNRMPGTKVDVSRLGQDTARLAKSLLLTRPSDKTLAAIGANTEPAKVAGLVIGSPEFQRR